MWEQIRILPPHYMGLVFAARFFFLIFTLDARLHESWVSHVCRMWCTDIFCSAPNISHILWTACAVCLSIVRLYRNREWFCVGVMIYSQAEGKWTECRFKIDTHTVVMFIAAGDHLCWNIVVWSNRHMNERLLGDSFKFKRNNTLLLKLSINQLFYQNCLDIRNEINLI